MSNSESKEDFNYPHERRIPSGPVEFNRQYRNRILEESGGVFCEVWDTLEVPFEAPGFPRGVMIFEAISPSRKGLVSQVVAFKRKADLLTRAGKFEVFDGPAEIRRCRLYKVPLHVEHGMYEYIQVWDTLAEPCEYRHELPSGELLVTAQDFSRRKIAQIIEDHQKTLGITFAGVWKIAVHT